MAFNYNQLYNRAQIRQIVAQDCGNGVYNTTTGIWDYDQTTFPTLTRINQIIDDSIREITSYDFQCLEAITSYPFIHQISGVQSAFFSGTNAPNCSGVNSVGSGIAYTAATISGTITPYPSDVLNYSWDANNTVANVVSNFSGNSFQGVDSSGNVWTGTSTYGYQTVATWTGLGYNYQLNPDVGKLLNPPVWIAKSNNNLTANGVFLQNIDFTDMLRTFPIGTVNASGTPQYIATSPGLSNANNNGISIVFGPFPTAAYSGNNFLLFHKKLHQTMQNDTDVQGVIPIDYQAVIPALVSAKVLRLIPGAESAQRAKDQLEYAQSLINQFKLWDWSQPSKVRVFRDANYDSSFNAAYDSSVYFRLGTMSH